jgi:Ca-activated chloride channel family protein
MLMSSAIVTKLVLAAVVLTVCISAISAQEPCVSADRLRTLKTQIESGKPGDPNADLRSRILEMRSVVAQLTSIPSMDKSAASAVNEKLRDLQRTEAPKLCDILNTSPWPGQSVVGIDGSSAWINLLKNYLDIKLQQQFLPLISVAVEKNEVKRDSELASMVDRMRVRLGQAQVFGTQAFPANGFIVLWPIQSEDRVDALRQEYGLSTLRDYIRSIQVVYRMLVIRSTAKPARVEVQSQETSGGDVLAQGISDKDVIRIETSTVTVDATVFANEVPNLQVKDFRVFEDGQEQELSVFDQPRSPFDIVLLLDLSGSTSDQLGWIKKTTKEFVELKRDIDRIAVVTFSSGETVVSPLEQDKSKLLKSLSKIKDRGGSDVWDAEHFAMQLLKTESAAGRRKAIVIMSDGVDNALSFGAASFGSKILFADLLEEVRNSSIAFIPIFLDTEASYPGLQRAYADSRRTLQLLADESGGNYYAAKEIKQLGKVYEKVMNDVGKVYSLGYEPKNSTRDGRWRSIRVEIVGHPELKVRARSGYYAR